MAVYKWTLFDLCFVLLIVIVKANDRYNEDWLELDEMVENIQFCQFSCRKHNLTTTETTRLEYERDKFMFDNNYQEYLIF